MRKKSSPGSLVAPMILSAARLRAKPLGLLSSLSLAFFFSFGSSFLVASDFRFSPPFLSPPPWIESILAVACLKFWCYIKSLWKKTKMYSWGTETPSKCLPYLHGFGIRRLFFLSEEFRELEENSWRMKNAHLILKEWEGFTFLSLASNSLILSSQSRFSTGSQVFSSSASKPVQIIVSTCCLLSFHGSQQVCIKYRRLIAWVQHGCH